MSTTPTPPTKLSPAQPITPEATQLNTGLERARTGHSFQGPYASGHADQHNGDNIYYYNRE